jgi:hypothetical protein
MKLISIDEKWPTEKDTDKNGKIWVYRIPSMTKWDRTGQLFKISLEQYTEPLNVEIIHFTQPYKKVEDNQYIHSPQKCTKLEYTKSSITAYNNRIQWPYWIPGHILLEPVERDDNKKAMISSNFPIVKGHITLEEYNKIINKK